MPVRRDDTVSRPHDLASLVAELGPLDPEVALGIIREVCQLLGLVHATGATHGQIGPSTVLVSDMPGGWRVGLAVGADGDRADADPGMAGFQAPEVLHDQVATVASDVFSVGALLWACLTGCGPSAQGGPGVVPQLPAAAPYSRHLNSVLTHALAVQPAHRFRSAAELGRALATSSLLTDMNRQPHPARR
jgi:serine/threonine protein kinase, bacterial